MRALPPTARDTGAHGVRADVASDADNQRVVEQCLSTMGGIDVLINNAGVGYTAEIGALDVDAMRELFATNVFGVVDLTNRVVPHDEGARRRRHRQHRLDVGHERRQGRHGLRRQQVGAARHHAVLAGRAAAARHPRRLHRAVGSADQLEGKTGRNNPNKLYADDIAATIMAGLAMPRRVLWTELAVFANNPWKED